MPDLKKLIIDIENRLGLTVQRFNTVSGGSINDVYQLQTPGKDFLLKTNSRHLYPGMFKMEQEGLQAIRATRTIAVPEIVLQSDVEDKSYLLLEWIKPGVNTTVSSLSLGQQLADLHKHTSVTFGFNTNNYMGSLPQSNRQRKTWTDFFVYERLEPMLKMAIDKNKLQSRDAAHFEEFYKKLPSLFDEEPPSLVHGDLWSGNYLIGLDERPYLVDPAVSYSNREFDIAMTTLFGGFSTIFYEAYNNAFPLQNGWQQRLSLWNLYPLLVHVNLFGGSYVQQTRQCLARFV